jgi:hypothetical protein
MSKDTIAEKHIYSLLSALGSIKLNTPNTTINHLIVNRFHLTRNQHRYGNYRTGSKPTFTIRKTDYAITTSHVQSAPAQPSLKPNQAKPKPNQIKYPHPIKLPENPLR